MLKNKILSCVFLGAVLVMLAVGFFAVSIHTHAAASSESTTTIVHANIVKTTAGYVFKRSAITVSLKSTFEFTNDTAISQTVTKPGGKTAVIVAAHSSAPYTFKAAGTYVFHLASNPKTKLTVTVK